MFTDDDLDELRRLIARREIDTIMTWRASDISRSLLEAIGAAGISI